MHVPKSFWADVVSTTRFLINCMLLFVLKGDIPFCTLCPKQPLFPISLKIFCLYLLCSLCLALRYKVGSKGLKMYLLWLFSCLEGVSVLLSQSKQIFHLLMSDSLNIPPFIPYLLFLRIQVRGASGG